MEQDLMPVRPHAEMSAAMAAAHVGETLVLHREDAVVGRRVVMGDTVRVGTVMQMREQRVDVALRHERVDIVHVPVVEEVRVVERRLRLVEEVRLRRVGEIEQHAETVVLRSQDARITREPAVAASASISEGAE